MAGVKGVFSMNSFRSGRGERPVICRQFERDDLSTIVQRSYWKKAEE